MVVKCRRKMAFHAYAGDTIVIAFASIPFHILILVHSPNLEDVFRLALMGGGDGDGRKRDRGRDLAIGFHPKSWGGFAICCIQQNMKLLFFTSQQQMHIVEKTGPSKCRDCPLLKAASPCSPSSISCIDTLYRGTRRHPRGSQPLRLPDSQP